MKTMTFGRTIAVMTLLSLAAASAAPVPYATPAPHPRLLCNQRDLDAIRGRIEGVVEARALQQMLKKCDGYLDPGSRLYVDWKEHKKSYWHNRSGATWLTKCFEELAWAGVLTGEANYIEGSKNIVLTIIRERVIDTIGGTNYGRAYGGWLSQPLDAGHSSRSLAVFYDLLYNHLSEAERTEVRDYMTGTYLSYFYDYMRKLPEGDRYPGILGHNFALIGNSAAALMTLAVWGETGNAELEKQWLETFIGGIEQYLDIGIGPDGGALEGAGYTSACLYYLCFPAEALRRAGGKDLFQHERLKKVWDYYLYEMLPGRNYYDNTNDSFFHAHTAPFLLFAKVHNRPELTWMWEEVSGRLTDPADVYGDGRNAAQPILNYILLWYGAAPKAQSPDDLEMPLGRRFARRGLVAMRTGWGKDGCLMSFTCGGNPEYGHGQYDSGHFAFYRGNSALAGDTGYGGGQSEDHNTVLFDGEGQKLKCPKGRITAFEPGQHATYTAGRAGDLYHNKALKKADRHIYFVHDQDHPYAVVFDDLEADGEEHDYTWMLQGVNSHGFMMSGEGIEIDVAGEHPVVTDNKTGWKMRIVMFAVEPPRFSSDVKELRWNRTAKAVPHPRLLANIRTKEEPAILTVLLPYKDGMPLPRVERVAPHALRLEWANYIDLIAFGPARTGEAETQGRGFVRTPRGE